MTIVVTESTFWQLVRRLREYEGRRCLWRVPIAGLLWALPGLLLVLVFVVSAYLAGDLTSFVRVLIAAVATVALSPLAARLGHRRLWRSIVADRLWTYEKPNINGAVPVLVRDVDMAAAQRALRRARFHPAAGIMLTVPPSDAAELNRQLRVEEPEAWATCTSDEQRISRVVEILDQAGVPARVAGRDVGRVLNDSASRTPASSDVPRSP